MKLDIHHDFKDGRDQFYVGEVVFVDDERGQRFIDNGWAALAGQSPKQVEQPATVTLDIHKGTIDITSIFNRIGKGA